MWVGDPLAECHAETGLIVAAFAMLGILPAANAWVAIDTGLSEHGRFQFKRCSAFIADGEVWAVHPTATTILPRSVLSAHFIVGASNCRSLTSRAKAMPSRKLLHDATMLSASPVDQFFGG
jgi:hypothetical protein